MEPQKVVVLEVKDLGSDPLKLSAPAKTLPDASVDAADGNDPHATKAPPGTSSLALATFNCISLLLGLGILSSPYAMAHAGWVGGGISLAVAAAYAYAAHLMVCCQRRTGCRTYQELAAAAAVGPRTCLVIQAFFYVEVVGSLLSFCISAADNLEKAFEGVPAVQQGLLGAASSGFLAPRNILLLLACACILPTVWLRDLRALSFTSVWSVATSGVLLASVALAASPVGGGIGFTHAIPLAGRPSSLPVAVGLYAFAYSGTTIFPAICSSMKDPSRFGQALGLSFGVTVAAVTGLGAMGASMFGAGTASQITLDMPAGRLTTKLTVWMTVLTPLLKFALVLSPLSAAVDSLVAGTGRRFLLGPRSQLLASSLARSAVLALVAIAAIALPFFNYVAALIGSSVSLALCLVFPCVFYARLCRDRLAPASVAALLAVSSLAAAAAVCGTVLSFQGLVDSSRGRAAAAAPA